MAGHGVVEYGSRARTWRRGRATPSSDARREGFGAAATTRGRHPGRTFGFLRARFSTASGLIDRKSMLATVAGVLVASGLALFVGGAAAPAVVWLLAWWFGSVALGRRASVGLPPAYAARLWPVIAGAGVLGLAVLGVTGGLSRAAVPAVRPESGWVLVMASALAVLAALAAGGSRGQRGPALLRWVSRQRDAVGPALVMGAGMAGLLLSLAGVEHPGQAVSWALFAAIVVSGPLAWGALLTWMRTAVWTDDAGPRTAARVRRLMLRFVGAYGALAAPAVLAGWLAPGPGTAAQACALGAVWVLTSVALGLGRGSRASALVFAAGVAVWVGAPAGPVMVVLFGLLAADLVAVGADVPRFGVYLLARPHVRRPHAGARS